MTTRLGLHLQIALLLAVIGPHCDLSAQTDQGSVVTQAQAALCQKAIPTDVQLNGTVSFTQGSTTDSGPITLKARLSGESRVDMALSGGAVSELRISGSDPQFKSYRNGSWTNAATHNSWTDTNWFFPAISGLLRGSVGSFNLTDTSLDANSPRIHQTWQIAGQKSDATALIQQLSTVDYDLDPVSYLPVDVSFLAHPEDDFNRGILVEATFSDYRDVSGVMVPFHIKRFVNGTLELDITISSAMINPGLSDSDFIAQ